MGLIDWFHPRFQQSAEDPLAAFDQRLEALDQRGTDLRNATATLLLTMRGLEELRERVLALGKNLSLQVQEAERCEDGARCALLAADRAQCCARARQLEADLAHIALEAAELKASVEQVGRAAQELRAERAATASRLEVTLEVT